MADVKKNIAVLASKPANEREMIFELSKRSNSAFMRKGDERSPNPRHLNAPKTFALPVTSRMYLGPEYGYINTQYIQGANTIFVEDYCMDESGGVYPAKFQEKIQGLTLRYGLKTQGYDLRAEEGRMKMRGISFINGTLYLSKWGEDPTLYEFVSTHENNEEAPNAKINTDRTVLRQFMFKPLRKEVKSESRLEKFEDQYAAMEFMAKMRTKAKNGGYTYNESLLNAVLAILGEGKTLTSNDNAQKMEICLRYATGDGIEFMNLINSEMAGYKMTIGKAISFNLLSVNAKQAVVAYGEDEKKRPVFDFDKDSKDEESRTEALTLFFIGDERGREEFRALSGAVDVAKAEDIAKGRN